MAKSMVKMQVLAPSAIKAEAEAEGGFMEFLREGAVSSELPLETYATAVETLFRAIELRTTAVANMPRQLEDLETGEILATENWAHPLLDDKGRPLSEKRLWSDLRLNIPLSRLLWQTEAAQTLLGQAYWLILRRGRRTVGARWMDPARVTPRVNFEGIYRYDYTRVMGSIASANSPLRPDEVCRIWRPSLRELEPGASPAQAAAQSAGLLFNANLFMRVFFANGAMPVTIVMSEDDPSEEERNRLKLFLGRMMRGIRNAFNIEVVSSLLKFEKLTPDIKDLDFTNLAQEKDRAIAVAMGIPFSVLFSGTGGSYAQSAEDDNYHFYDKTIVPEAAFIGSELNEQFFNPLGLHLSFRHDLLEIYQQRERLRVEMELELYDRGAITLDELRSAAGYREPLPATAVPPAQEKPPVPALTEDDDDDEEEDDEDPLVAEKRAELKRWESKVLKAMKRGKTAHSVPFVPDWLAVWEVEAIAQALHGAKTAEEVRTIMSSPFVGGGAGWLRHAPALSALKVHREDDVPLAQVERTAVESIRAGLSQQLAAIKARADELGGTNSDIIVLQVGQVLQEEQGALLGATQRLIYGSYSRGATVAGNLASIPSLGVDWQMMSREAYTFAERYSFELVTGLNQTTQAGLREALLRWVESGGRLDELADSLRPIFANEAATRRIEAYFRVDRARMIAETEATRAYAQGKIDTWLASGEVERGPEVAPPAHPRCRCDIATERQDDGTWLWRWDTARDERVCPICTGYKYVGVARQSPRSIMPPEPEELSEAAQARATLLREAEDVQAKIAELQVRYAELININAQLRSQLGNATTSNAILENLAEFSRVDKQILQLKKQRMHQFLYVDTPSSINAYSSISGDRLTEAVAQGVAEFSRLVHRNVIPSNAKVLFKGKSNRAYYDSNEVFLSPTSEAGTVIHELGHWLEDISPAIRDRVHAFYDRRTAGNELTPLRRFSEHFGQLEMTRVDEFINPYMGKEYVDKEGNRYGTEILSVGLELFYNDPVRLAKEDPDYFDFIFDLVRGR